MTEKWSGGQKLAAYFYDEAGYGSSTGRRTRAVAYAGGAVTSALADWYDTRGQVSAHRLAVDGANYDTGYTYDSADRVTTMTYPDGEVVTSGYDSAMRPKTLTGASAYVTDATYNALGAPTKISFGNTLNTQYRYYGMEFASATFYGRLRGICVSDLATCGDGDATSSARMNMAYAYDRVKNITTIADRMRQERMSYTYDELDRLTEWKQETPYGSGSYATQESYAYDQIGNIKSKTGVGSYGYVAKPHAATSAGANTYGYDANGNMTIRREGGITYTQNFNIDNKLASVFGNNQVWKFAYDADGNLVKKASASGTTIYVGKHYEVLDTTKRTGQVFVPSTQKSYGAYWKVEAVAPVVTKYYFFGGQRAAMRVGSGAPVYLHGDHLGSASLTTDSAGGVVGQMRYAPFGTVRWQSGAMPTDYTFQSQRSEGFGLSDFNARYYDPVLARFISADSVVPGAGNPQSFNRYSFVLNNPLKFTDPSGHAQITNEGTPSARILFDREQQGYFDSCYQANCFAYALVNFLKNNPEYNITFDSTTNTAEQSQLTMALWQMWQDTGKPINIQAVLGAMAIIGTAAAESGEIQPQTSDGSVPIRGGPREPVIIGENMAGRVQPYANKVGGKTINDWIPSNQWDLPKNKAWIEQMKREGRTIIDIGPDFQRRLKKFNRGETPYAEAYNAERRALANYDGYQKAFTRTSQFSGGFDSLTVSP